MIRTGEIASGRLVLEADLVRRLGMSRTPVREALRRLEAEGYLRPTSGRGYVVVELSHEDLFNVYRVRGALEGLAAEHAAARATSEDLVRLDGLYDRMSDAANRSDDEALTRLNSEFHSAIADVSGNTYLKSMLEDIHEVFERFRPNAVAQPVRRSDAHSEHGQLIRALRIGDQQLARALAEAHVRRALELRRELVARTEEDGAL